MSREPQKLVSHTRRARNIPLEPWRGPDPIFPGICRTLPASSSSTNGPKNPARRDVRLQPLHNFINGCGFIRSEQGKDLGLVRAERFVASAIEMLLPAPAIHRACPERAQFEHFQIVPSLRSPVSPPVGHAQCASRCFPTPRPSATPIDMQPMMRLRSESCAARQRFPSETSEIRAPTQRKNLPGEASAFSFLWPRSSGDAKNGDGFSMESIAHPVEELDYRRWIGPRDRRRHEVLNSPVQRWQKSPSGERPRPLC